MAGFHKRRQRKRATWLAWLGLAALWLTIGMPVLSRSLPQGFAPLDLGAWCTGHGLADHGRQVPADPSAPTDRCSYCSLFCHSPLLASDAGLSLAPVSLRRPPPVAVAVPDPPARQLAAARSRGPPSLG